MTRDRLLLFECSRSHHSSLLEVEAVAEASGFPLRAQEVAGEAQDNHRAGAELVRHHVGAEEEHPFLNKIRPNFFFLVLLREISSKYYEAAWVRNKPLFSGQPNSHNLSSSPTEVMMICYDFK